MGPGKAIRTFDGATAIVTGGASGIGRALSEELVKRGCEVVLADLQIELAEEVALAIRASGGKAEAVKIDVTDFPVIQHLVEETVKRTGRLDYMFNNAGIVIGGSVSLYSIEDWNRIIDVNLCGVINGIQAAYKIMITQGFGHIVNTASIAGLMHGPGNVAYTATKHAVVSLSESLRIEAAQAGVRVSVICPSAIRTPILEGGGKYGKMLMEIPPEQVRRMLERLRPMSPNIFAEKVLSLIAKNKAIIIVPSWWKLFWRINRLSPSLGMFLAQKSFQKNAEGARYRRKELTIQLKAKMSKSKRDIGNGWRQIFKDLTPYSWPRSLVPPVSIREEYRTKRRSSFLSGHLGCLDHDQWQTLQDSTSSPFHGLAGVGSHVCTLMCALAASES